MSLYRKTDPLPMMFILDTLSFRMQRHISLVIGLTITFGLALWLVFAIRNGTLDLGAAADFLRVR